MSDLIDRNVLKAKMYQEAFESDTDMQKWDSGCWIRYKLFEKVVDSTPTVPYGPRWHRVEDGLPKESGEYIVAYHPCYWDDVDTEVTKVGIDNFRGRSTWAKKKFQRVTHWMEKPEPPKEDA